MTSKTSITKHGAPPIGALLFKCGYTGIGKITAGVPSPTLGCGIDYARFNSPGNWAGKVLTLRLTDGTDNACEIVDLPIFDPDKNIVRGIDRTLPE